ncbi:MAG: hypothetical protein WCE75_04935 [Terracidiphilus sp.]
MLRTRYGQASRTGREDVSLGDAGVSAREESPVFRMPSRNECATERPKIQVNRAAGQRARHMFHQQQVGGAGQNEISGSPLCVHGQFDCEKDLWCSLGLIENDGARGKQRIGIALGLIENAYIIESEIRPRRLNRLCERGLAGLPRARQTQGRARPEGPF